MNLTLINTDYITAEEELKCEASEDFNKMFFEGKLKEVKHVGIIIFNLRKEIIRKDEQYVKYVFVDEDSGEVHEMKACIYADKQMRRLKLYPEIILNADYEKDLQQV